MPIDETYTKQADTQITEASDQDINKNEVKFLDKLW